MQTIYRQATDWSNAVVAMYNRARQLVLTCGALGNAEGLIFAQGSLNTLRSILETSGATFAARRDASMGGYQPLAGFEAAWAALPIDVERFTLTQVQEFLGLHGVEISADAVTDSKLDAVEQFKDGAVSVVNGHDEHDAARADLGDGAGEHGESLIVDEVVNVADMPERERYLLSALAAILLETADTPGLIKPYSFDSYLPEHLIADAVKALKPYGWPQDQPADAADAADAGGAA